MEIDARRRRCSGRRLPLFPSDDGWPYPDATIAANPSADDPIDLDALELRVDRHAFADLTEWEQLRGRADATGSTARRAR